MVLFHVKHAEQAVWHAEKAVMYPGRLYRVIDAFGSIVSELEYLGVDTDLRSIVEGIDIDTICCDEIQNGGV